MVAYVHIEYPTYQFSKESKWGGDGIHYSLADELFLRLPYIVFEFQYFLLFGEGQCQF